MNPDRDASTYGGSAIGMDAAAELHLVGELDIASAARLTRVATALLEGGIKVLTVNLHELTFLDAAGIGALVRTRRVVVARGGSVTLACAGGQPWHVLRLTGMEHVFDLRGYLPSTAPTVADQAAT